MNNFFLIIFYIISKSIKVKSAKKNLIIGVIKNYNWQQLKPFFVSLYNAKFENYECVMFFLGITQDTLNKLNSIGVITYQIPNKYKDMKINNVRYKLYVDYLSNKFEKYNIILHVDIRDTFFQKDLFKIYENKGSFIGLALENGNINEFMNAEWMKNQYGNIIYEELKNKRIICSGTIWGTIDKFYELVKNIWEQIELKSPYNYSIHDQTATNYLIYHKKILKDFIITSDNDSGPVMTLRIRTNHNFSFDFENNLLNFKDKNKVCLVHQYDGYSILEEKVKTKFLNKTETHIKINSPTITNQKFQSEKMKIIIISLLFIILLKKKFKKIVKYIYKTNKLLEIKIIKK